jgi:hypothetical protein
MARLGPAQAAAARQDERRADGPSQKSAEWFRDIMTRRQLPDKDGVTGAQRALQALALLDAGELTQRQVSQTIDAYKHCPLIQAPESAPVAVQGSPAGSALTDTVPDGHYALKTDSGELRFYRVKQGRKPGKYWIHVEHGPEETELYPSTARDVMLEILAEGARECALRYGRHIGCCSKCKARLTNRISRLVEFGPVCGGHYYDEEIWKRMRAQARDALRRAGLDPDADVEDTDDIEAIREQLRMVFV